MKIQRWFTTAYNRCQLRCWSLCWISMATQLYNRTTWDQELVRKVCRIMSTYPNAHAKIKKLISDIQFPENRFELGIIKNDFWSSTIWAIPIQVSFPEFENLKNPGIQPTNTTPLTQTESRHIEYQMNKVNFHISSMGRRRNRRGRLNCKDRVVLWRSSSSALTIEIRKLVLFIWYSLCRDSVCIIF